VVVVVVVRNKKVFLALLAVVIILAGCKMWLPWGKNADMSRTTPDGLYQQGLGLYQKSKYSDAIKLFQQVKEEYPLNPLAIMAEMGIADAYFSDKEYLDAELAYSDFLNLHPTNENLPYVMYQVGMCHFNEINTIDRDQSETFKALKAFERLMARFPDSKFSTMADKMVRDCKKLLGEQEFYVGEFYFNIKQYRAALRRFEKITRDYANVGLDQKVNHFIVETKKRIAEADVKNKSLENK
jgi:outer membrane protein assembly factor BamD